MGSCQGARNSNNPLEDSCKNIEEKFRLPTLQWRDYIISLTKYAFMGNLSTSQLTTFCEDIKVSKKELESNPVLKDFFEEFKMSNKLYDDFGLKAAGLFYCQGPFTEKAENIKFLLDPERKGKIPKSNLCLLLKKLMHLATVFTAKKSLEGNPYEKAIKELQALAEISPEQEEQIVLKWFPFPEGGDEFDTSILTTWVEKENLTPEAARKVALKVTEKKEAPK